MTRTSCTLALATLLHLPALAAQVGPGKYPLVQVNQTAVPAMYQDAKGANWSVVDGWIELYTNGSWMMRLNYRDPKGRKRSTMDFGNYTRTTDGYALTSSIFGLYKGVVHSQNLDVAYDVDNDKVAEHLSFGRQGSAAPQPTAAAAPQAAPTAPAAPVAPPPVAPPPSAAPPVAAPVPNAAPPATAPPASPEVHALGDVSFAVPPGWRYEPPPSGDRPATVVLGSGDDAVRVSVFRPVHPSGNAETDFRDAWTQLLGDTPAEPVYSYASPVGYSGTYGGFAETPYRRFYVLEAGSAAVPVLAVSRDRATFDDHSVAISVFIEGIRHAPLRAEPVKTTITLADLAGEWTSGGESSVNYVTSSGTYAGSSTVAHGATYVIASDGSYTYRFAGVTNRQIVRGEGGGRVELGEGTLTFREPAQNRVERYSIIAYQTALSGVTVLTLLDAQYPTTGANVAYYGEKWIRAGAATH